MLNGGSMMLDALLLVIGGALCIGLPGSLGFGARRHHMCYGQLCAGR
jgi:hypothetical protein